MSDPKKESVTSISWLLFYSLGVFFSYFFYGLVQEKITKSRYGVDQEQFHYIASMIFIQCIINAIVAKMALLFSQEVSDMPRSKLALCALSYIGAMFTSNASLQHVSYPTQVLGKSIKPIPVMLFGVIWAHKRYPLKKYVFVGMITLGVILFVFKDKQAKGPQLDSDHMIGTGEILLLISLALDGCTGAIQDSIFNTCKTGTYKMMFYINLFSMLYLGIYISLSGEIRHFINFVVAYPHSLPLLGLFGFTSAIGQIFIFSMLTAFGALMCSIVTTTRKFFTILGSVFLFNHPMSHRQWLGTVLVFLGLAFDQLFGKSQRR